MPPGRAGGCRSGGGDIPPSRPARPAASSARGTTACAARTARRAGVAYAGGMCRNIRPLHNFEPPASREEAHDAALQYVRKISGYTKPSKANEEAFLRAVDAVTEATTRLLDEL